MDESDKAWRDLIISITNEKPTSNVTFENAFRSLGAHIYQALVWLMEGGLTREEAFELLKIKGLLNNAD